MKAEETAETRRAIEFVRAIAGGNHSGAHGMLSARLRAQMTPAKLAADYREMVSYGEGVPTIVQVMTTMDEWPDKQPGDVRWVYVAIANDTFSEGATVVVAEEGGALVIRAVEWGRP
jgi:hypothetical protein